jgi:hypothetical protein
LSIASHSDAGFSELPLKSHVSPCGTSLRPECPNIKPNLHGFSELPLNSHSSPNTFPQHLRLAAEQASEQFRVIFIKFMEYYPTALDALFSLIESVANGEFRLAAFYILYHYIICNDSIDCDAQCGGLRYQERVTENQDFLVTQHCPSHRCYENHANLKAGKPQESSSNGQGCH